MRQFLTELDVWKQFLEDGHLESPGIASSWGGPNLYENDFILNPYGPGWHLDRCRFDLMLAHAAQASGVEVLRGVRATSIGHIATPLREGEPPGEPIANPARPEPRPPKSESGHRFHASSAGWLVGAVVDGQQIERRAAILVDATGRSSSIASRFGGRRIVYDRLVALVRLFQERSATATSNQRTIVEAVECGWWYTAPLPHGLRIATYLTDADLVPAGRRGRERFWYQQIEQAPHVRATVTAESRQDGLRVASACTARLSLAQTSNLLAVGDAVVSFDPLSSQGIMWALESGMAAAHPSAPPFIEIVRPSPSTLVGSRLNLATT